MFLFAARRYAGEAEGALPVPRACALS